MLPLYGWLLVLGSGFFLMLANVSMKFVDKLSLPLVAVLVLITGGIGAFLEIEALRLGKLGTTVTLVVASEILLSLVVAQFFVRERFSMVEMLGILMVIGGVALLGSGKSEAHAQTVVVEAGE